MKPKTGKESGMSQCTKCRQPTANLDGVCTLCLDHPPELVVRKVVTCEKAPCEKRLLPHAPCGGGRRVIRKGVES